MSTRSVGFSSSGSRIRRPAEEGHQERLAGALRVPDDAALAAAVARREHGVDCLPDGMELVVAGDLLDRATTLVFEDDEPAQHVEERPAVQEAMGERLQGQSLRLLDDGVPVDRAPPHEAVEASGDGPVARGEAVRDHRKHRRPEQVRDLVLVGLDLVPGRLEIGALGALELNDDERDPVQEQDHVRDPGRLANDVHLVEGVPLVLGIVPIDERAPAPTLLAVVEEVDGHAIHEEVVDAAVLGDQYPGRLGPEPSQPHRRRRHRGGLD